MYMHTLDEKPAAFDGKDYIFFASGGGKGRVTLARSLRQIRREQQRNIARVRREQGREFAERIIARLGYKLVEVPISISVGGSGGRISIKLRGRVR